MVRRHHNLILLLGLKWSRQSHGFALLTVRPFVINDNICGGVFLIIWGIHFTTSNTLTIIDLVFLRNNIVVINTST